MYCLVKPVFKSLSTATWGILSLPAIFSSKTSYPYLSSPSKPINIHLSFSPISVNTCTHASITVASVAEWAEQEPVTSFVEDEDEQVIVDAVGDAGDSGGDGGFEERGDVYQEPLEGTKLFVGNLEYDVDEAKLAQLFEQAGVVEVAEVIYNRGAAKSRGFGFVTMSTVEEADKAIEMFHHFDLKGKLLAVNKAAPIGSFRPPCPTHTIYVTNLPLDVDNERLGQFFSKHGSVVDARVIYDQYTRRSRRFGFVTMSTEAEMNDAVFNLNRKSFGGRTIKVKPSI